MLRWDNPFMALQRGILNYVLLSLLWILFCIPLLTIGASTSALYHTTRKFLLGEEGYLFSTFWEGFRKNFKQSTILWIILVAAGILIWQDIRIMRVISDATWSYVLQYAHYLIAFFLISVFLYGIPQIVRFNNNLRQIIKNSALMSIRHLFSTIFVMVLLVGGAIVVWLLPILLITMPALLMAFWSRRLEKLFSKYIDS